MLIHCSLRFFSFSFLFFLNNIIVLRNPMEAFIWTGRIFIEVWEKHVSDQ